MFQGNYQVGLEFCLVYTVFSWSSLCILPWTLFLLSWHLHRAGLRAVSNNTIVFDLIDIFGFRKFLYIKSSKVTKILCIFLSIDVKSCVAGAAGPRRTGPRHRHLRQHSPARQDLHRVGGGERRARRGGGAQAGQER